MSKQSTASPLFVLLLVISIAANVGFMSGCAAFHDLVYGNPCKYSAAVPQETGSDRSKEELVKIAKKLGIKKADEQTESGLSSKIVEKLEETLPLPDTFTTDELKEIEGLMSRSKYDKVQKLQQFVGDLKDKRVIVLELEAQ